MANERVLVVEDHEDAREMLVEWLQAMGYPSVAASNGAEALELLRAGVRPKLILLDLMMPIMDGWSFMAEAIREKLLRQTQVYVVSAADALQLPDGVDGALPKPVDLSMLLEIVRRACVR